MADSPCLEPTSKRRRANKRKSKTSAPQKTLKSLWGISPEDSPVDNEETKDSLVQRDVTPMKTIESEQESEQGDEPPLKATMPNPIFNKMMASNKHKRLSYQANTSPATRGRKKSKTKMRDTCNNTLHKFLRVPSQESFEFHEAGVSDELDSLPSKSLDLSIPDQWIAQELKAGDTKLETLETLEIKPLHPFFMKKTDAKSSPANSSPISTTTQKTSLSLLKPTLLNSLPLLTTFNPPLLLAPWPTITQMHVRGLEVPPTVCRIKKLSKLKSKSRIFSISDHENFLNHVLLQTKSIQVPHNDKCFPVPNIRIPTLTKYTRDELKEFALKSITRKSHKKLLKPLIRNLHSFSAFDMNEYETKSWVSKYAPSKGSSVLTDCSIGSKVTEWLINRFKELKNNSTSRKPHKSLLRPDKNKKRKSLYGDDLDGFIIDENSDSESDSEIEHMQRFLILHGPSGSGKTSSVYAAAQELDAYIFEVNPSDKRSGKKLFEKLGGMGKSHLVHRTKNGGSVESNFKQKSIVLLEEVDILFEEDQTFWTGLDKFIETAKRPVIMTCQNSTLLPVALTENHPESLLNFSHASSSLQCNALWLIALCEGHLVDKEAIRQLIKYNKCDFRSSLNDLQFWCQMGLGDRKSGINWILTDRERVKTGQQEIRNISNGTYIGPYSGDEIDIDLNPFDTHTSTLSAPTLDEWSTLTDIVSDIDYMRSGSRTQFATSLEEEYLMDRPLGLAELREFPEPVKPYPFELSIYPYLSDMTRKVYDLKVTDSATEKMTLTFKTSESLRDPVRFLSSSNEINTLGTGAPLSNYGIVNISSPCVLVTELLPTIRTIARADRRKAKESEKIRQLQSGPSTRRSMKSAFMSIGLSSRDLERHLDTDCLDEIIETAPLDWTEQSEIQC